MCKTTTTYGTDIYESLSPGLFNSAIYVADPALPPNDKTAWLGVQVYLRRGNFPQLSEGDRVDIRGIMHSFRGEREILVERPEDIWRVGPGEPLQPLPIETSEVGEPLEGRLVTFEGIVTGWQGVSIFLGDPNNADAEPRWLDIWSMCTSYLPAIGNSAQIEQIFYFSALAHHRSASDPGTIACHELFIECLMDTGVTPEMGRFKQKSSQCRRCG